MAAEEQIPIRPPVGREESVLTVYELTVRIKGLLETQFRKVLVRGEISNFVAHTSGHYYFTLKDERAQIGAVMFKFANRRLKFRPEDGMEVIAAGRISLYEPHGKYQVIIDELEPAGLGALQKAFEQLKIKLEKEGLFESARKRPIPRFPSVIAIITSPTGAAIRDMLNITRRRFANINILICPVRVQGEGAADQIAQAIQDLNLGCPDVDVLIVSRGGGSLEDLWAFNEERVARAIVGSKIPVISAVGHEIDFTIADFVADLRAPTPSAAAELVVRDQLELIRHIESLSKRLIGSLRRFDELRLRLDHADQGLLSALQRMLEQARHRLETGCARLNTLSPFAKLADGKRRLAGSWERLRSFAERLLESPRLRASTLFAKVEALSPLGILARGYSITKNAQTDRVLVSVTEVSVGDEIRTVLKDGALISKIAKTLDNS